MKPFRLVFMLRVALLAFIIPFTAGATVKKEGSWPTVDKKVSLEFDGKPSEGLKKLAKEADWSLVIKDGVGVEGSSIHVDVVNQPAELVLDALFSGHDVVAHRNGTLVTLRPAGDSGTPKAVGSVTPPVADAKTPAPIATVRGEDRNVIGGSLVISRDEVVHTVTVAGGSVRVEGTVTGDLVIAGGSGTVASGGRVFGNATVFGGELEVENNGRIDGEVGVAGGELKREEGAIIGGRVVDKAHPGNVKVTVNDDGVKTGSTPADEPRRSGLSAAVHDFGQSMTKMALLFVLGCVLLALLTRRMEKVQAEVATRPMRSFAVGIVASLGGAIAGAILIVVLCITVIGIPVAIMGVLTLVLALYGAIASVLTTFGAAVLGHRSQNPYLHLLAGCFAFLVVSSIPWVGGLVTFAVTMIAAGVLVTTRVGGLLERAR
ncbi:MAG TPA: hypothetical protein VM925_13680 [Labilithrix sp.]|nr:hypothetical protein [Labilithrix sp.]